MLDELLLLSGNDIPFVLAQISIRQPKIKEIGLIGEENFYMGCEMLTFSKDILNEADKINLAEQSDFDILMSVLLDKNQAIYKNKIATRAVLSLLFPDYQIAFTHKAIKLIKELEGEEVETHSINSENFNSFKEIITAIFCLKGYSSDDTPEYNPGGRLAQQIADKLKKRREVLAKQKGEQKVSVLNRYVSILAVGEQKDMNQLLNYTVYQLFDEFKRYELKEMFDYYMKAKLAGARDLKEVDNWKKDLHSNVDKFDI